jgi:hypothetical protein
MLSWCGVAVRNELVRLAIGLVNALCMETDGGDQ